MRKYLLGFTLVLLILACSQKAPEQEMDMRVIARAGDIEFTMYDLRNYMMRMNYSDPDDEMRKKEDFLKQHLDKLLVADAGIKLGLLDSVEVDTGQVSRILYETIYRREITEKLDVNDKTTRQFWEKYGGEVHLAQLLVKDIDLADSLYDVLSTDPDKFTEVVSLFSEDKVSKENEGDIGWRRFVDIPYELLNPVFELKEGEISRPLKSPYGYNIIKFMGRRAFTEDDYEKEKSIYRQRYSILRRDILQRELAERLGRQFDFKIDKDVLQMVIDRALQLRREKFSEDQPLSFCISVDDLTDDERNLVVAGFDGYEYSVGDFISELKKRYRREGIEFDNVEVSEQNITMMVLPRLMRKYGLVAGIKDSPQFQRQYEDIRNALVYIKMMKEHILDTIEVSQQEIVEQYNNTIYNFTEPEQIKCSEIQTETELEAREVLDKLGAGIPFSELVKNTTRPGFAETNGNLGFCSQRHFGPIYNAAREKKMGEFAGPISFDGKWSVIRIDEIKPKHVKPLSEVEGQVKTMLLGSKKYEVNQAWLEQQKKKVENYIDLDLVRETLESGKLEDEK
jgi:parvulin-like peptidyl-prolyl isomerase